MNFDFSSEQYMFQDSVRGFLAEAWSPARLRSLMGGTGLDEDLWRGLTELGLQAIMVPEEHGGLGLGLVDLALVLEECGRALVPGPALETAISAEVIARFGTEDQKASLLPRLAEGGLRIVPALTEAEGGLDVSEIGTEAVAGGNGWRLSGRKIMVPYGHLADRLLVSARFGEAGAVGLVLIEPDRAGVTLRPHELLDPASRASEATFENVAVEDGDILGGSPSAASVARLANASATVAAAQMTGTAGKVLDLAVEYAGQRVQFGRPIGSFQAIKHRCADMMVMLETSRTSAYYAAWALANDAPDVDKAVSMAKAYCGDAARFICNEGLQIHGGIGFTWELDLHLYLRRAKALEYAYGDAAAHRERVLTCALGEQEPV